MGPFMIDSINIKNYCMLKYVQILYEIPSKLPAVEHLCIDSIGREVRVWNLHEARISDRGLTQ